MRTLIGLVLIGLLTSCAEEVVPPGECTHGVTSAERAEGFVLLFDGHSMDQWRSYGEEGIDRGWGVENGCLTRLGFAGDLITRRQFGDFDLRLEWRISEAGNSGIFVRGDERGPSIHHSGYEMQILDNVGHRDSKDPTHRAGALYDMIAPKHDTTQPVGYWNRVRIVAQGPRVVFWLNDQVTAEFEQGSDDFLARYARSKFTDRPRYGTLLEGHIGLQDHFDKVWFRNLRVREIP
ncbi:MAG: DUF1080 domain-containing protein [Pseudomonadota bacterium]